MKNNVSRIKESNEHVIYFEKKSLTNINLYKGLPSLIASIIRYEPFKLYRKIVPVSSPSEQLGNHRLL